MRAVNVFLKNKYGVFLSYSSNNVYVVICMQ